MKDYLKEINKKINDIRNLMEPVNIYANIHSDTYLSLLDKAQKEMEYTLNPMKKIYDEINPMKDIIDSINPYKF